jgi:glycosyltransferase involved in cell wall biosynthesis
MRLAVVRDFREELWPSMDLCADQLLAHLPENIEREAIEPPFLRFASRFPFTRRAGFNADRILNRHLLLPRVVRCVARRADFVHVVDHSYAHLVTACPPGHAGVYCHDLDAFRSLLEPESEPRPWWFRQLARRTLNGLRRAVVIFHNSATTGRHLLASGITTPDRLAHVPLGVAPEFAPVASKPVGLPPAVVSPFLLHVGSNIPRKRLDVLLDVFAAAWARNPDLRLVQVGGPWPANCVEQIARLGVGQAVSQVRGLTRDQLAELYRRATVVLVPSEAEGFGLPVIEAMACGAAVIASDIPTLREAGGDAALYRPVADLPAWVDAVDLVLHYRDRIPSRELRLAWAARFTWSEHARIIAETYLALANSGPGPRRPA